jgi:hypothetical protein
VEARKRRLQAAVAQLRRDCLAARADVADALSVLEGVVDRGLRAATGMPLDGDPAKYRQLRLHNPTFIARTGGSAAAADVLTAAGFRRDADGWLRLPDDAARVDVAGLWLARDVLRDARQ